MRKSFNGLWIFVSVALLTISSTAASNAANSQSSTKVAASPTAKATAKPGSSANKAPKTALTAAQIACLKKNGIQAGAGKPAKTKQSPGTPAKKETGANKGQGSKSGKSEAEKAKIKAAYAKCGIQNGKKPGVVGQNSNNTKPTQQVGASSGTNPKQIAFIKCMSAAGIKPSGTMLAYDQSDPDTALTLVKCQKSTGYSIPKK